MCHDRPWKDWIRICKLKFERSYYFVPKQAKERSETLSTQIVWKYTWTADQVRSLKRSDKQDGLS